MPRRLFKTLFASIAMPQASRGATTRVPASLAALMAGLLAVMTPTQFAAAEVDNNAFRYSGSSDGEYKLGARDKVRIQVFEWRPARDEIYAWEALNAEYTVDESGRLALPLVGQVPAAGSSTGELAAVISRRLQERMGTVTEPDTTVEIVQYRPFYIVGQVEKPGEYNFRPGMTVLQAVSISGGLLRSTGTDAMSLARDLVRTEGDETLMEHEHDMLLARHARLTAELDGHASVVFPSVLAAKANVPAIGALMENERLVFNSRLKAFNTQMSALSQLKSNLEKEVTSLGRQVEAHNRRVELLERELSGIRTLAQKGLATTPRLLGLERNLAQLQGDGLRLESRQTAVSQDITRTEISMIELQTKRANDITEAMQDTSIQLARIGTRQTVNDRLLNDTRQRAALQLSQPAQINRITPSYVIVRTLAGDSFELTANEASVLLPGDTLKVEMQLAGAGDSEQGSATNAQPGASLDLSKVPKRAALQDLRLP